MTIFLMSVIILSGILYAFIGAAVGAVYDTDAKKRCRWQRSEQCDSECGHRVTAIFIGAIWPLGLPGVYGCKLGQHLSTADERAEKRRKKERAEYEKARDIIRDAGIDWPEVDWPVAQ